MTPRSRRSLIMIFISLALATAAALLASRWMLDRAQVAQSQRPTTQGLMIASRDLAAGTRLETEDVKAMQVVAADRPMGSFISKDEVVGQIVTTELRAGELVLAPHLSEDVEGSVRARGKTATRADPSPEGPAVPSALGAVLDAISGGGDDPPAPGGPAPVPVDPAAVEPAPIEPPQ